MGNLSKQMETLKKYQKEILEIKNVVTDMKNFVGLISELDMAE
jgi:hypothetical protein